MKDNADGTSRAGNSDGDGVAEFVRDLVALRDEHTSISYAQMESAAFDSLKVKTSSTSLNNAINSARARGKMPSEKQLAGLVAGLTRNQETLDEWTRRYAKLVGSDEAVDVIGGESRSRKSGPGRRARGRIVAIWIGIVAVVVASNVITGVTVAHLVRQPQQMDVATGANPAETMCVDDAQTVNSTSEGGFLLEIIFSPNCGAAWGRITREDDQAFGNQVVVTTYRRSDPDGPTRQVAVEPDIRSAFSTLIVRQDPTDRLCVEGSMTSGETRSTSGPLCI